MEYIVHRGNWVEPAPLSSDYLVLDGVRILRSNASKYIKGRVPSYWTTSYLDQQWKKGEAQQPIFDQDAFAYYYAIQMAKEHVYPEQYNRNMKIYGWYWNYMAIHNNKAYDQKIFDLRMEKEERGWNTPDDAYQDMVSMLSAEKARDELDEAEGEVITRRYVRKLGDAPGAPKYRYYSDNNSECTPNGTRIHNLIDAPVINEMSSSGSLSGSFGSSDSSYVTESTELSSRRSRSSLDDDDFESDDDSSTKRSRISDDMSVITFDDDGMGSIHSGNSGDSFGSGSSGSSGSSVSSGGSYSSRRGGGYSSSLTRSCGVTVEEEAIAIAAVQAMIAHNRKQKPKRRRRVLRRRTYRRSYRRRRY
jgi:hypothetical protein